MNNDKTGRGLGRREEGPFLATVPSESDEGWASWSRMVIEYLQDLIDCCV